MEYGLRQMQYLAGVISEQAYHEAGDAPAEQGGFSPAASKLMAAIKKVLKRHGMPGDAEFSGSGAELTMHVSGELYDKLVASKMPYSLPKRDISDAARDNGMKVSYAGTARGGDFRFTPMAAD